MPLFDNFSIHLKSIFINKYVTNNKNNLYNVFKKVLKQKEIQNYIKILQTTIC
jgi:hypothetical protein